MSIRDYRQVYKTEQGFEYPFFFEQYQNALASVWRPEEVSLESDIRDWQHASAQEKEVVAGILRGFTQLECHVSDYWSNIPNWFPKHEIAAGIEQCILQVGQTLKDTFPYDASTDKNELSDEIIFGK